MKKYTYFVRDLQFVLQEGVICTVLFADVKVHACTYLYGDDADGNRGVWVTDRDSEIVAVRDVDGFYVDKVTEEMEAEVQRIISEKGSSLE